VGAGITTIGLSNSAFFEVTMAMAGSAARDRTIGSIWVE
jgi:hypothetical protein